MPTNAAGEEIKGYIGEVAGLIYFHDGKDVYRAMPSSVVDIRTGYLQGRWECSVAHFNRFEADALGLPHVHL